MKLSEIYTNLCVYDKRNPMFYDLYYDEDDEVNARDNCYCDNCFYGRDELAVEILRLREESNE